MMQLTDAVRAECVPAVHEDAGNTFAHIVLEATELTNVEATRLVI